MNINTIEEQQPIICYNIYELLQIVRGISTDSFRKTNKAHQHALSSHQ